MHRRSDSTSDAPLLAWGDALRAARLRHRQAARRAAALAAGVALIAATIVAPPAPRLVWNVSASAPIGLYAVSPGASVDPGEMVIARVPAGVRMLAAQRRYIPVNVPLVKHVAAIAGDDVCARGPNISINERRVAARRSLDGSGRPLPWWHGCVRLHGRQLFLLMAKRPTSFDGRYFGVTDPADVIGKARPLWTR